MKVVISYGSPEWDISDLAVSQYCQMKGLTDEKSEKRTEMEEALKTDQIPRHDSTLVKIVECLGKGSGRLQVRNIKGIRYIIETDEDGWEYILEPQDIEWITGI